MENGLHKSEREWIAASSDVAEGIAWIERWLFCGCRVKAT